MDREQRSTELAHERRDLDKAERDISAGAERVVHQQELINKLTCQGHDTVQAQILLDNLEEMLGAWRDHRTLIIRRIAVLEEAD